MTTYLLACTTAPTTPFVEKSTQTFQTTQTLSPHPTQTFTLTPSFNIIDREATADAFTNWRVCEGALTPLLKADLSPNKEWLVINCDPSPPSGITTTKVFRLDGSVSWEISFYESYGVNIGIKNGYMGIVHWSEDENYLYLDPVFCCVDAPEYVFFNFFGNSIGVYRLDLNTGKLTTTLQPSLDSLLSSYAVSFSSKDKYLTYVHSSNPTDIHIQSIQTRKLEKFSLNGEYSASGLFTWSPDNKKLVFLAAKQGWQPYDDTQPQDSVSYFMLDIETGALQHLFDKQNLYKPIWITNDKLTLNQLLDGDDFLLYNFQSSSFSAITPTPYK